MPKPDIIIQVMKGRLSLLDTSALDWDHAAKAADGLGLSHAEITLACEQAAKDAILGNETMVRVHDSVLATALAERRPTHG